jgi:hypothetical protein
MMNFRRIALVSGLAVLSAVAFAPKAGAVPTNQDVNFDATITGVCTFTGTTPGTLVQDSPINSWLEASNGTLIGTIGTTGETTVKCTSGGQLSVAAPVKVSAPPSFTSSVNHAVVYDSTAGAYTSAGTALNPGWVKSTTALTIPLNTDRILKVGMLTGENLQNGLPSGYYNYTVTLTATPN